MFVLEIQPTGNPMTFELCRSDSADAVAAVVLALCRSELAAPITIRAVPGALSAPPVRPGPWPEEVT